MKQFLAVVVLCVSLLAAHAADAETVLYVPSDELSDHWVVSRSAPPKYPKGPDNKVKETCAVVGYIIEANGRTSSEQAIAAYPHKRYGESAAKAIRKFQFEPGESNPERKPVYTTAMFIFQLGRSDETNEKVQAALGDICRSAADQLLAPDTDEPAADGAPSNSPAENTDQPNDRGLYSKQALRSVCALVGHLTGRGAPFRNWNLNN